MAATGWDGSVRFRILLGYGGGDEGLRRNQPAHATSEARLRGSGRATARCGTGGALPVPPANALERLPQAGSVSQPRQAVLSVVGWYGEPASMGPAKRGGKTMQSQLAIAGLLASGLVMAADVSTLGPVTFSKDVLPILQKNCQTCHRPGQIAPMSFLAYQSTRPWAKAMKAAVAARKMPDRK